MVETKLLEKDAAKSLYESRNMVFKEDICEAMVLVDKENILGVCLFEIENGKITIASLSPESDVMLADGVLRSALFIAANRGIMEADYSEGVSGDLIKRLGFAGAQNNSIDITNLFSSCGNCKKDD